MKNKELKQDTKIKFKVADLSGTGKIVGIADNSQPIIGKKYIIEPDVPIRSEVYNYTHFTAFESQIEVIE